MSEPLLHIYDDTDDYNVTTTTAMGGTELSYKWMSENVDKNLLDQFQIICSRLRDLEDKPRIFWVHDTASDPEVQFLQKEPEKLNLFETIVFVSNWQQQQYSMYLGVPYEKGVVLQHAITPIPVHEKPTEKIKLIYASTPHRGLEVLLNAFEILNRKDVELHIYSSMKIYGRDEQDKTFKPLYCRAKYMDNVFYHGSKSNDEVREAMTGCHILAYPSIYPETACITAIEAMSAGMICVLPNLAALPETCANFAWMYNYVSNPRDHAKVFAGVLNGAIDQYWEKSVQNLLKTQKAYFDLFYSWESRAYKWNQLMESILLSTK